MIPYGRHHIDQSDIDAVVEVLKSDWLTCGPVVEAFEQALARTVEARYAVACSNGTTALHLAMVVLGIKPGDIVLVPAITFLASANAARYVGADVAFIDVDPTTGLITAETVEEAILAQGHKKIKALINVHFAGQCGNLEAIKKIAKKYGLFIIEDAAHAIGTQYRAEDGKNYPIGSNAFSDITTFSFHPVKTIAMGEGGAITTNNPEIAEKLKLYRSHGMLRDPLKWQEGKEGGPWYYEMQELGYNYRVSDINCALGLSQLRKLENFKDYRAQLVKKYDEAFESMPHIRPLRKVSTSDTAWHLYVILMDFEKIYKTRGQVMEDLKEAGFGSQVHYIPLYRQPYYKKLYGDIKLKGAEEYYAQCLSLPLYVGLEEDKILLISQKLGKNLHIM